MKIECSEVPKPSFLPLLWPAERKMPAPSEAKCGWNICRRIDPNSSFVYQNNNTQCQLCKTLAWPIISHSWFGIEFSPLEQPFFCVLGRFWDDDEQSNEQPTGWSKSKPVLDQWEGSLLQNPDFQIVSHRLAQPEVSKDTLLRLEEMFRQQPEWVSPTMWKLWSDFACKVVCQGKDNNKRFLQYLTTYLKR